MRLAFAPLAVASALLAVVPVASAQTSPPSQAVVQSINAEVMFIHARNDRSGVDPRLQTLVELKSPPFTGWNSFHVLGDTTVGMPLNRATSVSMPTRDIFVATFTGTAANDPKRFVISSSIQKQGGGTILPNVTVNAQSGKWFFITGQSYSGGTLIIALKVL